MSMEEKLTEVKENVDEAVEEAIEAAVEETEETDIVEIIKNSDFGKAVFGNDGKFDGEDIKRLSEEAGNAIKEGIEKVKDLFQ